MSDKVISENAVIVKRIAGEIGVNQLQAAETLSLLEDGGTVPFIARYRKEATGNLDEVQIRDAFFMELQEGSILLKNGEFVVPMPVADG